MLRLFSCAHVERPAACHARGMEPQETLAEMIGTTRSRVNFFLNKFKRLGFIEYNGEIPLKTTARC
jgi:DNA-binding IclR family transcriptional regulator